MFFKYLNELCGFGLHDRILIFDYENILKEDYLSNISIEYEYELTYYLDVEEFRYLYESLIKKGSAKHLVIIRDDIYLPYDIRKTFYCKEISYGSIFPKLNSYILENSFIIDMDLLYIAYENLYRTIDSEAETKTFLSEEIFLETNISEYSQYIIDEVKVKLDKGKDYSTWSRIALLYAKLEYIRYKSNCEPVNQKFMHDLQCEFKEYILNNYSSLSSNSAFNGPILVNRGLDYIFMNSKKVALIVMDGMSILDWLIISNELKGVSFKYNSTFALIPTITAISRQSLLSGKLPIQMEKPFNLVNEKKQFIEKCMENGYKEDEIRYERGYEIDIENKDKCISIIINDIDDLVHSQKQGNFGMYNDVNFLAKGGKLLELIKKLYENGFDVYIASDHGHKESITVGTPKGSGVEVQTKSKRTIILKDFGDYEKFKDEFEMIEYPPYYLPKDYNYLICEHDKSFGIIDNTSVSHGGISIEEVVVPFIKIEGVNK